MMKPVPVHATYQRTVVIHVAHFNEGSTYPLYERARALLALPSVSREGLLDAGKLLHEVLRQTHGHNFRIRVSASLGATVDAWPGAIAWDEDIVAVIMEWHDQNLSIHPDFAQHDLDSPLRRATAENMCLVLARKLRERNAIADNVSIFVSIHETDEIEATLAEVAL